MPTILETTLVRTPEVCGGRLRIDGTRMTVNQIVSMHKHGMTAAEIIDQYPQRTLSEIYTVLAWYHANKIAFDRELAAEATEEERVRAELQQAKR